jgi:hypothetical protein
MKRDHVADLEEISKRLSDHEERLKKLERSVFKGPLVKRVSGIGVNVEELPFVKSLDLVLDKCLGLLNYFFGKDPMNLDLSPDEMVSIFKENFGLPMPLTSISSALLGAAGTYVTRKKEKYGKTIRYRYQILPRGQEYLRDKIRQLR